MSIKNVIIFDLEATCNDTGNWENETIQIGAISCLFGSTFNAYIKPVRTAITPFCTTLTGITPEIAAKGFSFKDALSAFISWAGTDPVFASWGYYDKHQIAKDCAAHNLPLPLMNHVSLKHNYARLKNSSPKGMKDVLRREGLKMDGRHHDGLDDAINISKIYALYGPSLL